MTQLGLYFRDQITQQLNMLVKEEYAEYMIMQPEGQGLLPFNTSLNPLQKYYEYDLFRSQGIAEFISTGVDDLPRVSMYVDKKYGEIYDIGNSYEFTDREVELAALTGQPIQRLALDAAKQGHDVLLEDIYYNGAVGKNLQGFLNFPGVTVETLLPDGAGGNTTFASKTPEQQYRDLTTMTRRLGERTKNRYYVETLLLPLTVYNIVAQTLLPNDASGGRTILETFMRNQRFSPWGVKQIIPVPYLEGKGTGGTGYGVGYMRDARYVQAILPEYFTVHPNPAPVNFKYVVNTRSSTAGTVVFKPLSMTYFDGL